MQKNTKKNKEEGLVIVEADLDFKTYAILLALVEKSGYKIDPKSREKSDGIRGVLTQGILELYQKYVEENGIDDEEPLHHGLDKVDQQAYIFANRARAMRKNQIPKEKIVSTLKRKLPVYLKDHKKGKLLAEETMQEFVAASTFSSIKRPKTTKGMREDFKKREIYKYFLKPTKKS